jgi:hypothetical protein
MGMTIDEAIEFGEKHYHTSLSSFETREERVEHIRKLGDYEHLAIETMRKYQKIEQILDDCDLEAWEVLEMIKKVVEDGKID